METRARVRTGATSWADRSLIATGWYPPSVKSAADRLRCYASRFGLVENDSSYWALPDRRRTQAWATAAPPGFTMNMKAHALLTGHYTDPRRLPRDIRDRLSPALREKRRVYPRDLGPALVERVARTFHDALEPLHDAGTLGAVLFQFPVWVPFSRDGRERLRRLAREFAPYRIAVEFRNATWMAGDTADKTLALLSREGLTYTCVDEPQGFASSVPPIAAVTADLAMVRLHGRNAARWHKGASSAAERFEYLYSPDELGEWVPRIDGLARQAGEVHVLMNNCYADYAVRNAADMARLLDQRRPALAVPPAGPTQPPETRP